MTYMQFAAGCMPASVSSCSRRGDVKVNDWFTLRRKRPAGTQIARRRQHFSQKFLGRAGGSTSRPGETLDGFSFVILGSGGLNALPTQPGNRPSMNPNRTRPPRRSGGRRAAGAPRAGIQPAMDRHRIRRGLRRRPSRAVATCSTSIRISSSLCTPPSFRSAIRASSRSMSMPSPARSPIRFCMAAGRILAST